MKIAYVSQPWSWVAPPVETADSIAIWTYEVAKRLADRADVTIFAKRFPRQSRFESQGGISYRRVPVPYDALWRRALRKAISPLGWKTASFEAPQYHLGYVAQIGLAARLQNYEIVHLHQFSQFAPVVRALAPNARIVLHMQAEWLTQLDKAVIEKRLQSVDAVFTCSAFLADKARARFPQMADRIFVVANGADVHQLAPTDPKPQAERSGPPRVVFVGRVSPEKAVHVVVQAFTRVAEQVPDVELHVLGPAAVAPKAFIVDMADDPRVRALAPWYEGDYYARLKELVPPALKSRVHFAGAIERSQLRDHYATAHVLVNPSLSETFGMTLIEALASGVPVVATPIGGMCELVVDEQTGLYAEPGDPESLATSIVRLLVDAKLRQSIADVGRRMVLERYTWDAVAEQAMAAYRKIL